MDEKTISTFDHGTVRVGATLAAADALWIKPYTAVAVGATTTGAFDVYASFDGESYFAYSLGTVVEQGFMRCWKARIPACWLKFVGRATADTEAIADGTLLPWGAKS
jgi:hypothetical protein